VARFVFLDKLVFTMTHHGEEQLQLDDADPAEDASAGSSGTPPK
jgi:hypothetical protein